MRHDLSSPSYSRQRRYQVSTLLLSCPTGKNPTVEDRIRRYRQSPVTHANHEETSTNVRPTRSAIINGLHNNRRPGIHRAQPGRKGPLRRTTLPLTHLQDLSLRDAREVLWRHLLATYKKENCTSRPRPNGTKTSTEGAPSEEATSI